MNKPSDHDNPMINFPHIVLNWNAYTNEVICAYGPYSTQTEAEMFIENLSDDNFENSRYTVEPCLASVTA